MYFYNPESKSVRLSVHQLLFLFRRQNSLYKPGKHGALAIGPLCECGCLKLYPLPLFPPGLLLLASLLPLSVDEDLNTSAPTTPANVPLSPRLVPAAEKSIQSDLFQQNRVKKDHYSPAACCSAARRHSVHAHREINPQKLQQTFGIQTPC